MGRQAWYLMESTGAIASLPLLKACFIHLCTSCKCNVKFDVTGLFSQRMFHRSWAQVNCHLFVANLWHQILYRIRIHMKYEPGFSHCLGAPWIVLGGILSIPHWCLAVFSFKNQVSGMNEWNDQIVSKVKSLPKYPPPPYCKCSVCLNRSTCFCAREENIALFTPE